MGETRRSLQDFDQAIQLDRSLAKAFTNRGNIHQSSGRYDHALADYSAAVELDLKDAYSLYSRGLTMRALGYEEQAKLAILRRQTRLSQASDPSPELGVADLTIFHGD